MDIGLNPETWGRGQTGGQQASLDWQGLRARFLAGSAVRRAWAAPDRKAVSGGSFNTESARILGSYAVAQKQGLATVNPSALGDGKDQGGKNMPVAGKQRPAVEE